MKKDRNEERPDDKAGGGSSAGLRGRAEERLRAKEPEKVLPRAEADSKKLIHELEVHRIELEMQNEELRLARFEAEESRAKYADLYDFAPVGYLTLDEKGFISGLNIAAATLLGAERSLLVHKPFASHVHADYQGEFLSHLKKVLRSREKEVCELTLTKKDGTVFHGQLETLKVTGDGNQAVRMIVQDITPRKKTEEELKKAKERLELLVEERTAELGRAGLRIQTGEDERLRLVAAVEQSIEGVLLLDEADLKVNYGNPAFLKLSGYRLDELIGKDVRLLRSDTYDGAFYESLQEKVAQGGTWTGEYPLKRKDGSVTLTEMTISPIRNAAGKTVSRVVTCHDITEKRLLETELRHSQKMEAIGTLAGGIAHDFNNILGAIIGFTEMVMDDIPPDNPMHHRLDLVLKSGFRGRDLVRQILSFSRKAEQERAPLLLTPLIKETLKLLRASLPSTIRITTVTATSSDIIRANPSEVQQIVMNLCTNGADSMGANGGELTVTLSEAGTLPDSTLPPELPPGSYIEIAVKDTGTGVAPEMMKRIFEPFFTTKDVGKGTGLGLSVVYGIVKSLKGEITAESAPGSGSTFRVFLPLEKMDVSGDSPTDPVSGGKERILFIDDEELLAELGEGLLGRLGYGVTAVADPAEALRLFSEDPSRFDLVFTDQTMPGITGVEIAGRLLRIRPDIPVVLCTGYSDLVSTETAMAMGIRGFLMKPLSRHELAAAIRRVLDAKSDA